MKLSALKRAALAAGVVSTTLIGVTTGQAQAVDSLLDKLVDKGVLTPKEATELRTEADHNFTKAYQVKSGMPDWVTALKINGDLRLRFESISAESRDFPGSEPLSLPPPSRDGRGAEGSIRSGLPAHVERSIGKLWR